MPSPRPLLPSFSMSPPTRSAAPPPPPPPATRLPRHGRVEHQVVQAAVGADLLICARDGHRGRLGPHSLAPTTRFVVDHALCPVLLVWPEPAPGSDTLPPPPGAHPPRP